MRKRHKLVGNDVILHNELDPTNVGHHVCCCRNFTALKYRREDETDDLDLVKPSRSAQQSEYFSMCINLFYEYKCIMYTGIKVVVRTRR